MEQSQIIEQIVYLIKTLTWDVSGDILFRADNVIASPFDPYDILDFHSYPNCKVVPLGSKSSLGNSNRRNEVTYEIGIDITHSVQGDKKGEASLLGRNVTSSSIGKGIFEIVEKVKTALEFLTAKNGFDFEFLSESAAGVDPVGEDGNETSIRMSFSSRGTTAKTYSRPLSLRATTAGGDVSLTWTNAPIRFDTKKVELWRHTSEITTYGTGSKITLSGDTATSVTDSAPGSATHYYSVFGIYEISDTSGLVEKQSEPFNYRIVVP